MMAGDSDQVYTAAAAGGGASSVGGAYSGGGTLSFGVASSGGNVYSCRVAAGSGGAAAGSVADTIVTGTGRWQVRRSWVRKRQRWWLRSVSHPN
jgi:hypothetical protein